MEISLIIIVTNQDILQEMNIFGFMRNIFPGPAIFSLCLLLSVSACTPPATPAAPDRQRSPAYANQALPEVNPCVVPEPRVPSSAFEMYRSDAHEKSGYWVRYQCKQSCKDWRQCLAPAYSDDDGSLLSSGRDAELPKQALAFVVDGMAGHIAISSDGDKTVFIHTGAGGTRYYSVPAEKLERNSSARTVMVRWEKGYASPIVQPPFSQPITWGWYTRTSAEATDIKQLNKRVASIIAWSHNNLSSTEMFGTLGCSMGTNATFGPVLWHGLDAIIDYQLFVGGPNMWDLNAQCGRRHYTQGYCDVDGSTMCSIDSDCRNQGADSHCTAPGPYTTIDLTFEQLPNHIHVTDACDIRAAEKSTPLPYPPFDESSMAFADGADWEVDHPMDFLVNLGAKQGASYTEGIGGDEYWGLGHFPPIYNRIKPDKNKSWYAIPDSHHCGAMFDEALDLIKERMGL